MLSMEYRGNEEIHNCVKVNLFFADKKLSDLSKQEEKIYNEFDNKKYCR